MIYYRPIILQQDRSGHFKPDKIISDFCYKYSSYPNTSSLAPLSRGLSSSSCYKPSCYRGSTVVVAVALDTPDCLLAIFAQPAEAVTHTRSICHRSISFPFSLPLPSFIHTAVPAPSRPSSNSLSSFISFLPCLR